MEPLYTRYIQETFGPDGQVTDWHYQYEDNFNYAYDIIDTMAAAEPWRLAMLWRNDRGAELKLTLEDLSVMSNRMANLFRSHGLKRGDVILTALRSHWSWWIVALAAHKLGLILAPCSYLLSEQDFLYRMTKAKAKCVVTCRENGADRRVLAAAEQAGVSVRFALGGGSGYLDLLGNMDKQPGVLGRIPTSAKDPILLYFTSGTTGQPKGVLHDGAYTLSNYWGAKYMQDIHPGKDDARRYLQFLTLTIDYATRLCFEEQQAIKKKQAVLFSKQTAGSLAYIQRADRNLFNELQKINSETPEKK